MRAARGSPQLEPRELTQHEQRLTDGPGGPLHQDALPSLCVRNAVEEHLFSVRNGTVVGLGVSLGVACFPDDGETSEELLTAAARRMQSDKNARKTVLTVASAGLSAIDMMT